MIAEHLPVLVVVIPFLSGLSAPFTGKGQRAWALASLASLATFAVALSLALQVMEHGPVSYDLGGWGLDARGLRIGIQYRVDALNALVLVLVSGLAAVITPASRLSAMRELDPDKLHVFYAVWLLCLTGLLGITVTGDAFNLYVLLEISSLTTYTLVALGGDRDRRAFSASITYLVMGTVGASLLLLGVGYLIMATGTLNMGEMAVRIAELHDSRTVRTAFAFVMAGITLKMALFPVHQWLPNAYTYAPTPVSAFLASTATKVGVYVAIRFVFTIFGASFSYRILGLDGLLIGMSCLAILFGSMLAIRQRELKRLLAYSSVAQIGYLVLGFALGNESGLTGSLLHLVNHALVKGALFLAAGCVIYRVGGSSLDDLAGLGRRMPLTALALTLGGLGLVGVPLTGGFVSKWYLVSAALERGWWPVALVILAGSLLAVGYVMRFVRPLYYEEPVLGGEEPAEAPPALVLPALVLVAGSLAAGVFGVGGELAREAARQLGAVP